MPRHTPAATLATLLRYPVVPVFYHADAANAQRIVQAATPAVFGCLSL